MLHKVHPTSTPNLLKFAETHPLWYELHLLSFNLRVQTLKSCHFCANMAYGWLKHIHAMGSGHIPAKY